MSNDLRRGILVNSLWSFIGRFGYLGISLTANVVLVRLLGPKEFGQIGIVMFFITVANVLTESGLSGALIRKVNVTEADYSTIFIFNLIVSMVLMVVLIAMSGHIADFYQDAELKSVLVVTSLVLLINALKITQSTRLVKELRFKRKSAYEIIAVLLASVVAVVLASYGKGVWSLVAMQLSIASFLVILLWLCEGVPKIFLFSAQSFKEFYKFGVNTTLASLLNTAFDNIYQLVLGKYFSINHAGYFYQAKKLQEMPVSVLSSIMHGAVYSALSRLRQEPAEFNALYQEVVKYLTVIVAFICLMIFCYAYTVVMLLYGDEWLSSVFYLQLLTIAAFFYLQEMCNRVIFKVFDETGKILLLEILKKLVQLGTIFFGVWMLSIEYLLYGFVISSAFSFVVNYYCARRVQSYFAWDDVFCILKIVFVAVSIAAAFNGLAAIEEASLTWQLISMPVVSVSYFFLLKVFRVLDLPKEFRQMVTLIR